MPYMPRNLERFWVGTVYGPENQTHGGNSMDVGTLDVRRKPCPEGHYRGTIMDVTWKPAVIEGENTKRASVRIQILTDNPNTDETTKGKSVFDRIPFTEKMAWKFGHVYAAAFDVFEDDDELAEMNEEKFNGIKNKEVYFDVVHDVIVDQETQKPRTMVNLRNYRSVQREEQAE